MNKITVVSAIRQDAPYLDVYLRQLSLQSREHFEFVSVVLVHDGDGAILRDRLAQLRDLALNVVLVRELASDGGITSIEDKVLQWARIGNQGFAAALQGGATHILWLETDLTVPYDLIDQLVANQLDIVAPLVFIGPWFYDSWGFRTLNGEQIRKIQPEWNIDARPVELSSVGSCVLFRREILDAGVRFRGPYDDGLLVGMCLDARKLGYKVFVDPNVSIIHPTSAWRNQIWRVVAFVIEVPGQASRMIELNPTWIAAAHYDEFIVKLIEYDEPLKRDIGDGSYAVTVIRNPSNRKMVLRLQRDPASQGAGRGVSVSKVQHVVTQPDASPLPAAA